MVALIFASCAARNAVSLPASARDSTTWPSSRPILPNLYALGAGTTAVTLALIFMVLIAVNLKAAVFGTPAIVRGFGGYLDTVTDVTPSSSGCEDCERIGGNWVHRRRHSWEVQFSSTSQSQCRARTHQS